MPNVNKSFVNRAVSVVGVIGLTGFLAIVLGQEYQKRKADREKTERLVKSLSTYFIRSEYDQIRKWVDGEFKDAWGNSLVIYPTTTNVVAVSSMGRDGKLGTEDDLTEVVTYGPSVVQEVNHWREQHPAILEKPYVKPSMGQRFRKWAWGD